MEPTLAARLRALEQATAQRDTRRIERAQRAQDASHVADAIADLKARNPGPRAAPGLEARLRTFDRLAARLDEAERRLQAAEQQHERARRELLTTLAAESVALMAVSDPSARAQRASALADAQRQAEAEADTVSMDTFRPLLDVTLGVDEGGPDLDAKAALLEAEQTRGHEQLERLAQARRLLEARLDVARRLAAEAETARREAGSAQPLLQREADALKLRVRDLQASREALARTDADLRRALATIEARLIEAARRRQAGPGSTTP
jgi:hypothetical protein